jgi:hypothetical protein
MHAEATFQGTSILALEIAWEVEVLLGRFPNVAVNPD